MASFDVELRPFETLLVEYGPDPEFGIGRYRELCGKYGQAAAIAGAMEHYKSNLCVVREMEVEEGVVIPWIEDGGRALIRRGGDVAGKICGPPRYVGSRRQCHAFIEGREPDQTWVEM